jgi:hypothetical protein
MYGCRCWRKVSKDRLGVPRDSHFLPFLVQSLPVDGTYIPCRVTFHPTVRPRCPLPGTYPPITSSRRPFEMRDRELDNASISQWTLTLLSVWWAFGQLAASLISWVFIANYSCDASIPAGQCPKAQNMGWRYTLWVKERCAVACWADPQCSRYTLLVFDQCSTA